MIAEKYEALEECADECVSSVGNYIHRGTEQISQMIDDRPTRAVLLSCLAGFGVGVLLSRAFLPEERATSYSAFDRGTAERFGRSLLEKVEHALPAMLRERLSK